MDFAKAMTFLLAGVVMLVASADRANAGDVSAYFPSDTAIVAHVNVMKVLGSEILSKEIKKLKGKIEDNAQIMQLGDMLGFDPFSDLTSITLVISRESEKNDGKGLVIAKGDFDTDKIIDFAKQATAKKGNPLNEQEYCGVTIYSGDKKGGAAFVDEETLLVGDLRHLKMAIKLATGKGAQSLDARFKAILREVDRDAAIWAAAYMAPKLRRNILKKGDIASKMFAEIVAVNASIDAGDSLEVKIKVTFQNPDEAEGAVDILNLKLDVAKAVAKHLDAVFYDVLDEVKVLSAGSTVEVNMKLSAALVLETIKDLKSLKDKQWRMVRGLRKFAKGMKK